VIRTAIPAEGPTGPNLIGQLVERPRERYRARYVRPDSLDSGPADVVALVPLQRDAPYAEALIWVNRKDGLLRRIEIADASGQRRVVALRNVTVNTAVSRREFTFSPPAGSRVVDQ
jgi:outer membrane lipoprotein-sorting protein